MWKEIDIQKFVSIFDGSTLDREDRKEGYRVFTLKDRTKLKIESNFNIKNDYSIQLISPSLYWWVELSDKEYVLEEYPNAVIQRSLNHQRYAIYAANIPDATKLGEGKTEDEAWTNAANILKEEYGE